MSEEGESISVVSESGMEDSLKTEKQLSDANGGINGSLVKENVTDDDRDDYANVDHDQLLEMVIELKFQNEILKSQFEGLKTLRSEDDGSCQQKEVVQESRKSVDVKELYERIESLSKELHEEKETRGAAEKALEHLRVAYSEADAKAQEFSTKLAEAQQKLDQEIKEREEKYTELDSKFSRLHKRAKQRIQEVQKEKDDLDARFREVTETAERASSQHSALQQELERTRQQANDALKAMDAERQQLRSANNKLRDNIEELRCSLQPKENALEALQQSLLEKEQILEDMRASIQAAEEKRQASIAELSAKHQKNLESLEAQLADALSDRSKATETISSLQVLIAEKESKIAEMEAASTGKAARLRAAVETVKGEIAHLKNEHENEKESWEAASQALKKKLEIAESNCIRAEIEAAKLRSQLESEMSVQTQMLSSRDAELMALKKEISRIESEFSSYKVRAHSLLQKKDAELAAANDSEQLKALEEALKEAEKEVSLVSEERDKALQDLHDALANHDKELAERDAALDNARQQIKNLEIKLDSLNAQHLLEKETWGKTLQNVEESWQVRCELLKSQNEASSGLDVQKELEELRLQYKRLKGEHDSFRDLADRMIEERDSEISRILDENKNLQRSLESRPTANHSDNYSAASQKQDAMNSGTSVAEQQILLLARQQAQREEELAQTQRHILALQEEIEELEHENRLHTQQEAMLKEELRNMERKLKREGVDMTYLKNVVVKLLETGEVEALLPVIAMLLQFSPEEMQKCQQADRSSTDVPPTPPSDASGSSLSLFSRFSFS
ncbi:protein GRIP [Mangifera indica]|uniref:protein GRIP n=1 Tax=Mangifera indica TaxID=29780 RepID=UPI001CFBC31D|nr:protein GRIP [Mangifera indica]XP_044470268.1 protein GRIP [Mangifera indica]